MRNNDVVQARHSFPPCRLKLHQSICLAAPSERERGQPSMDAYGLRPIMGRSRDTHVPEPGASWIIHGTEGVPRGASRARGAWSTQHSIVRTLRMVRHEN